MRSEELVKQLGGHIAFARPLGLTRAEVPADLVAKEKEIAVEQAKATGKPRGDRDQDRRGEIEFIFRRARAAGPGILQRGRVQRFDRELPEAKWRDAGEVCPH